MTIDTSRDTFKGYSIDSKLNTLFDFAVAGQGRIEKLEKRKKLDTAIAAGTGILGGFTAMLAKLSFWA